MTSSGDRNSTRESTKPINGLTPINTAESQVSHQTSQANPTSTLNTSSNLNATFQHIQDTATKRIATLDYLRKTHDGHMFWYNTLLFTRADLAKMPYFEARKLARRATNFLMLGMSVPTIMEANTNGGGLQDYLRTLNALLLEFETYQQVHSAERYAASSLSRARLPQMFKRATHANRGRRQSSATEIGSPLASSDLSQNKSGMNGGGASAPSSASFPAGDQDLLPGEEYTYLLTPSLPFDPDYFETYATLCDVLIDCYVRVLDATTTPSALTPGIAEAFAKVDTRLRKVILSGVIKEFEDASRGGIKAELAGLNKVLLGGLI